MGQTAGKITDSEMCCGGKRARDRNNHIKQNPPPASSFADGLFNFGMAEDCQDSHPPHQYSAARDQPRVTQPFIEPAPRETGPRRGMVQRKAPKFTIVAEPDPPPAQRPDEIMRDDETMLHEIVSHSAHPKPLGVRANQHHSSVPYSNPNVSWTNGRVPDNGLSNAAYASNTGNLERQRHLQPASNDSYTDAMNISRSSSHSGLGGASGSFYGGNSSARLSMPGSGKGPDGSLSRSFDSPGEASGQARTVSSSPLAPLARMAPSNPLAARGKLPEGALPKALASGRAGHYLPTSNTSSDAAASDEDTTENFIAEVKSLIDKSKEQLKKAEFRRSRKHMLAQQDLDSGMPPPPPHLSGSAPAKLLGAPHAQSFLAYNNRC